MKSGLFSNPLPNLTKMML